MSIVTPPAGSQIIRGHLYSQGLAGLWLMNEGAGFPQDISGHKRHTKAGAMTWGVGTEGLEFVGDGSTEWLDTDWIPTGLTGCTILAAIRPEATGGDDYIVDFSDGSKGAILRYDASNNRAEAAFFNSGTTVMNGSAMSETEYHVVGCVCSPTTQFLWLDGAVDGSPIAGIASIDDAGASMSIGAEYDGDNKFRGEIAWVMIWDRGLSAADLASLNSDPFQMVLRSRAILIAPAVGGTTHEASGVIAAQSVISGAVLRDRAAAGVVAGQSVISGAAVRDRTAAGVIEGQSVISGSATTAQTHNASGTITGQAVISGVMVRDRSAVGIIEGQSVISGAMVRDRSAAGIVEGQSVISGMVVTGAVTHSIAGIIAGQSVISGAVVMDLAAGGIIVGQSVISGGIVEIGSFEFVSGLIECQSVLNGAVSRDRNIGGQIVGQSVVNGRTVLVVAVGGTVAAISVLNGRVVATWAASGTIAGQSVISGGVSDYQFIPGWAWPRNEILDGIMR